MTDDFIVIQQDNDLFQINNKTAQDMEIDRIIEKALNDNPCQLSFLDVSSEQNNSEALIRESLY